MDVEGTQLEMIDSGKGKPILFLHPHIGLHGADPFVDRLASSARVLAPSHPGFGRTGLPKGFTSVDDIAYFYLDLLDQMDLHGVLLVGSSFGAWIAMELAVKSTQRISRLVLLNPVGAKFGTRETSDLVDIFAVAQPRLHELSYHDIAHAHRDYASLSDDALAIIARNRQSSALYAWNPYMHAPKLAQRLHRIRIPTLVLCGASDRMMAQGWGRRYAEAIPGAGGGAGYREIAAAGHFPHIEQPEAVARLIGEFAAAGAVSP
ncbi:MAG: alpha/beta fold hydrolase [Betaproteobacteria bacterium]|nr:alpha/beta fold hydrolase [Betaproteobacteria bacterium]